MEHLKSSGHTYSQSTLRTMFIAASLLLGIGFTCVWVGKHYTGMPRNYAWTFQGFYSPLVQEQIKTYIDFHLSQGSSAFEPEAFFNQLGQAFPIIKSCTYQQATPDTINVLVTGIAPICRINDTYFLGERGHIHSSFNFTDIRLLNLHQIYMSESLFNQLQADHINLLGSIPKAVWSRYEISYRNYANIVLQPKKALWQYCLQADENSVVQERKIKTAHDVSRHLISDEVDMYERSKRLQVDIRFDQRVYAQLKRTKKGMGR